MVKKFETAGISAVCIEDKKFPKVNSFVAGRQELAPIAEFVGKIMAAKNAQNTKDFLVFARIEALIAGLGLSEALRRADAYMDAGADGIFIHSRSKNPNEIISFCKKWKKRGILLVCPTTYPMLKEKDMKRLGIDITIYANHGIRASIKNINSVLSHIKEHGLENVESKIASMEDVFHLQDMHIMKKEEKKYLKSEMGSSKAIIAAAGGKIDNSLKGLLEDRPLAMLDINGKSLIQRNVDTLNNVGIQDINVIVGYKRENIGIEGVNIVENPHYGTKGIMYSIMKGASEPSEKNIVLYSDIIFDKELISKLLKKEGDIILAVDNTYKKAHLRNKKLELVVTENLPCNSVRMINTGRDNRILNIGRDIPGSKAHYEFIGLACLTKKGLNVLAKEYQKAMGKTSKSRSKAKSVENLSFADFIQYMIKKGHNVLAHEVTSGWMEVHNFNDYKNASSILSE